MSERLDELRTKFDDMRDCLRDAEEGLRVLQGKAADAIAAVESQEREVELLRNALHVIENEILRHSGL